MKLRDSISLASVFAMSVALMSCAGGSSNAPSNLKTISVSLGKAPTVLSVNATAQLSASITNDAANAGVSWSVVCGVVTTAGGTTTSDTTPGACGSFSKMTATSAVYTAPAAIPPGKTVTITASAVSAPFFTSSTTIAIEGISVQINGSSFSIQNLLVNGTTNLTATVSDDTANAGVTWALTCSDTTPGACGALSNSTVTATTYTAPATAPTGNNALVTATSVTDPTKSASVEIMIGQMAVQLTSLPSTVPTTGTTALTAMVFHDLQAAGVNWSVACGSASCGTITNSSATTTGITTTVTATYTAPAVVPPGKTVTVTASSVTQPSVSRSTVITIQAITVALSGVPASLPINNQATNLTATVTNDFASAGVAWSASCAPAGLVCGSFNPTTTQSATPTVYTAPSSVPSPATVTVTATSITDPSSFASATIAITPPPLADGTYVFSLAGFNANVSSPYYLAGAFVVSGGLITSGEQDYDDDSVFYLEDPISGGSMSTATDGNVQIVLTTADPSVGSGGTETINAAMISASSGQIMEFDDSVTSSGTLNLQTSAAEPTQGYAFYVTGLDSSISPVAIGGVLDINGSGTISGTGSVFDINDSGSVLQKQSFSASTVSAPDNFGRVVFTLNPKPVSGIANINLAGYIVDGSHIQLVETSNDSFLGTMGGTAIGQGANTGTFSTSSVSGLSFVAGLRGYDVGAGPLQAAGLFSTSSGHVTGDVNYNDLSGTGPSTPSPITGGTYTVDSTGRVTMSNVTDGIDTFTLQFYLTGSGQDSEQTVVSMDSTDVLAGVGFQQTGGGSFASSSFSGNYSLDVSGVDLNVNEFDAVGTMAADGSSKVTGSIDINSLSNGPQPSSITVNGNFSANANGAFTGTMTGLDLLNGTQDTLVYYLIDSTKVFAIETDTNQEMLLDFELE